MSWVLVTGAGGFVGGHCVRHLLSEGYKVIALQRSYKVISGAPDQDTDNFQRLIGDLVDPIESPVQIGSVIHLAAQVVFPEITTEQFVKGNVLSTLGMFELAERLNVETVVMHSSTSVYGEPGTGTFRETTPSTSPAAYGATKYLCELAASDFSSRMHVVIPRTPGILGPGANPNWLTFQTARALAGENLKISNAESLFNSTLHVADYCAFVQKVLEKGNACTGLDIVNLAAAPPVTVREVMEAIIQTSDSNSTIEDIGPRGHTATIDICKAERLYGFRARSVADTVSLYVQEVVNNIRAVAE